MTLALQAEHVLGLPLLPRLFPDEMLGMRPPEPFAQGHGDGEQSCVLRKARLGCCAATDQLS